MKAHRHLPRPYLIRQRQVGAALIFSLVFLLLLTIVGVTAMQSSTVQERMAGNVRDQNLAFQAAEVALRKGENDVDSVSFSPSFFATGPYRMPIANPTDVTTWTGYTWNDANSTKFGDSLGIAISASNNPRYVVEEVGNSSGAASSGSAVDFESKLKIDDPIIYRITARGLGATGKTTVILQSTFRRHL